MVTVIYAHNRFTDRGGYTPYQRVAGVLPRAALDLLSDKDPLEELSSIPGEGDFERAQQVRAAALRAFVNHSVRPRVRRAEAAHTKVSERFTPGEVMYLLRKGAYNKYYRWGPGTVCATQGSSAWDPWVSARGELYKVSTMALRRADPSEVEAVEEVHGALRDMVTDVSRQC
eukprot:5007471-Amphidinium_carterae.4